MSYDHTDYTNINQSIIQKKKSDILYIPMSFI